MCGKNLALPLLLCCLALPLSGQSFEPSAVYEVTGTWLNERESESRTANEALKNSKAENERLLRKIDELSAKYEADLKARDESLTEVSRQLSEASTLIQNSQNEALAAKAWVAAGGFTVGVLVGVAFFSLVH